jgi:hypothetical protein
MKIILFVILMVSGMYSLVGLLDIGEEENKKFEELKKKKTFAEKIIVPKGMEKEYKLIMQGKNPLVEEKINKEEKTNKIEKTQHIYLKTKIKNLGIINDHLISNIIIYNNSKNLKKGFVKIICKGYNNGSETDIYQWKGNINIKSKKAILLKDMDFGYASLNKVDNYWCYVDSFKEH